MKTEQIAGAGLIAVAAWLFMGDSKQPVKPDPVPVKPSPAPVPEPVKPKKPDRPLWDDPRIVGSLPTLGGKEYQGAQIMCDLPASEKKRNVGGRDGAGLCVFTSIEWAARWSNERRLFDFQKQMRQEPGGGYPEKVDKMIAKYGKGTQYVQHTGGDIEFLKAAIATGRMPGVTYGGYDPHYRGYVAHMVNLVYLDDKLAAISDNNFTGDNEIVWMSTDEFKKRWNMGSAGWAVVLLAGPPSPVPIN